MTLSCAVLLRKAYVPSKATLYVLYQRSPFCLWSSPSPTSTRLDSNCKGSVVVTYSVTDCFCPFTNVSVTFGVFSSETAAGGDCDCGAPQRRATRPSSI